MNRRCDFGLRASGKMVCNACGGEAEHVAEHGSRKGFAYCRDAALEAATGESAGQREEPEQTTFDREEHGGLDRGEE